MSEMDPHERWVMENEAAEAAADRRLAEQVESARQMHSEYTAKAARWEDDQAQRHIEHMNMLERIAAALEKIAGGRT